MTLFGTPPCPPFLVTPCANGTLATDDIEIKAESATLVHLKPRRAGGFSRRGSRWAGIKAHIERKGKFEMAGLEIHGQAMDPDIDSTYDLYKTIEIDFENGPSELSPLLFFVVCGWWFGC